MNNVRKSIQVLVFVTFVVTSFAAVSVPIFAAGGIPVIRSLTATPGTQISPGQSITPVAKAIGGEGNLTYHWSGGCSGSGTGRDVTGMFNDNRTPGTRYCTVRFCDIDGDCTQDSLPITVLGATNPPAQPIITSQPATSRATSSTSTSSGSITPSAVSTTATSTVSVSTTSSSVPSVGTVTSTLTSITTSSSATSSLPITDRQTCATAKRAILSGKVFYDQNRNYVQNEEEDGAVNIKIVITQADPEDELFQREIATDSIGHWQTDLCPGEYRISLNPAQLSLGTTLSSPSALGVIMQPGVNIKDQNFMLVSQTSFAVNNFINIARDYWWVGVIIGGILLLALLYVWTRATRVEYLRVRG